MERGKRKMNTAELLAETARKDATRKIIIDLLKAKEQGKTFDEVIKDLEKTLA